MTITSMFPRAATLTACLLAVIGPGASDAASQRKPRVTCTAEAIILEYDFGAPEVVTAGDGARVTVSGLKRHNQEGEPVIPVGHAQILLPSGTRIEAVTSEALDVYPLPGTHELEHGAVQFFRHVGPPATPTRPDPAIYSSTEYWPLEQHALVTVQSDRGYRIAHVNLFPLQYAPRSGLLRMAPRMRLTVHLASSDSPYRVSPTEALTRKLRRHLDNPGALASYSNPNRGGVTPPPNPASTSLTTPLSDPRSPYYGADYEYIVITNDSLANVTGQYSFQALCDSKISRGIPAGIVTTDWICANYDGSKPSGGSDDATRIRNFLIDAYQVWDSEYALLAGTEDIIPARMFFHSGYTVPADLYYGCVDPPDCTFDEDADGKYAEKHDGPGGGDVDLRAEVFVGRAAVENASDVRNFVEKTLVYESTDDPYLNVAATMGGYLGFGDIQEFNKPFSELMRLGSSLYLGHFTAGLESPSIPNARDFSVTTLYDEDYAPSSWNRVGHVNPPWDYYSDGWDATTELLPILNGEGAFTTPQIIYIADHGDSNWGMVKLCTTPHSYNMYDCIENLTNTDYFLFVDDSCWVGSFDVDDCFAEEITTMEHGAFACLVNSRDGLGASGNNLDSVTTMFIREFFHSPLGEGTFELGRALQEARERCLWRLDSIGWFRYQYYELTLFGDPELRLRVADNL